MKPRSLIFLLLLNTIFSTSAGFAIGIVNECEEMQDIEEKGWCLLDLSVKEKTLKYCNDLNDWQSISQCIDAVAKATTLKPKDCADITRYSQYCMDKLGFEKVSEWAAPNEQVLAPCVGMLKTQSKPQPEDYSAYDRNLPLEKGPPSALRRELFVQLKSLRRSLTASQRSPTDSRMTYERIMKTCEDRAHQAELGDMVRIIQAQGLKF